MLRLPLAIACLVACTASLFAGGLGDSVETLDKEYGKPKVHQGDERVYIKASGLFSGPAMIVSVEIHNGRVWAIAYRKEDETPLLGYEVIDLLKLNEQGLKGVTWNPPTAESDTMAHWKRKDSAAYANYNERSYWMRFWSAERAAANAK